MWIHNLYWWTPPCLFHSCFCWLAEARSAVLGVSLDTMDEHSKILKRRHPRCLEAIGYPQSMDWFKGKFTGKPHDLNGQINMATLPWVKLGRFVKPLKMCYFCRSMLIYQRVLVCLVILGGITWRTKSQHMDWMGILKQDNWVLTNEDWMRLSPSSKLRKRCGKPMVSILKYLYMANFPPRILHFIQEWPWPYRIYHVPWPWHKSGTVANGAKKSRVICGANFHQTQNLIGILANVQGLYVQSSAWYHPEN